MASVRGIVAMSHYYEKLNWPKDAKSYEKAACFFSIMCYILGALWLLFCAISLFILIVAFEDGGLPALLPILFHCFLATLIIVFGWMMSGLSRTLLAIFEMKMAANRQSINQEDVEA